jgi:hypothetical protein
MSVPRLNLAADDVASITALVESIASGWDTVESPEFLAEAAVLASELPQALRRFVSSARIREDQLFAISGWRVESTGIGRTPPSWTDASTSRTQRHEILLVLFASLLGDPFGMSGLQGGRVINHIIPLRGAESTVTAFSSTGALDWHTESAGLDCRPDYQAFLCLRNPERVPVLVSSLTRTRLARDTMRILREPRFVINAPGPDGEVFVTIPVLFGDRRRPYMRIDPVYMKAQAGDGEAAGALDAICTRLRDAIEPFEPQAGDLYVIDNYQLVHGRPSFRPRYDGSDRWLMRVKIAKDIRRSREYRDAAASRVVNLSF